MNRKSIFIFISALLLVAGNLYSQVIVDSRAKISNVDFNLEKDTFIITYDLLNTKASEQYRVTVHIFTEGGREVNASSLKGDIGSPVYGGVRKEITWDIGKDIAYLDDRVYVEIEAVHINPKIIKETGKGKALLLSVIFPGLGSSKTRLSKGHIAKGIAGYGLFAGGLGLTSSANTNFDAYRDAETGAERDRLYELANKQDKLSTTLLISAAAVWTLDLITVLVTPNRSIKSGFKSEIVFMDNHNGQSIPGISLAYNF